MQDKLEKTLRNLQEKEEELTTAKQELNKTEKEMTSLQTESSRIKSDLSKLENEKKDLENKLHAEKKESGYWESKASELETDLQVPMFMSYEFQRLYCYYVVSTNVILTYCFF